MDNEIIIFDDTEIGEHKFHQYKSSIWINGIDVNKIVVSNEFPSGRQDFKYFIGYKDYEKIKPLRIFFPEANAYRIDLDETECMSFLIKDKEVLEKYNDTLEKVSSIIKKI